MKLITEYDELSKAEEISDRLRRAGVMTVVTGKNSFRLSSSKTGVLKVGLWVVFDDQYKDAILLLKNRKHKPFRKLSLKEINDLDESAKRKLSFSGKKIFEKIAVFITSSIIILLVIYVAIGVIKEA